MADEDDLDALATPVGDIRVVVSHNEDGTARHYVVCVNVQEVRTLVHDIGLDNYWPNLRSYMLIPADD